MKNKYSFDKKQKELLYSDDWSCKLCGSNQELQGHHIKHKRDLSNSIYNLLWICKKCHSKYGSSSAEDTKKHLQIAKNAVDTKIKRLQEKDLFFDKEKFLTKIDLDFLKENEKYYN